MRAYRELERRFAALSHLHGALAVLHWDSAAMMPPGGADARSEQIATLSEIAHRQLTDPALADLLAEAADPAPADAWRHANLREMRRRWRHAAALDADLVVRRSRATSACELAWREARGDDDFARIVPLLEEVLAATREVAAAKAEALDLSPYDALLDGYDPGMRAREIDLVFAELEAFLPDFVQRVLERQRTMPPPVRPTGPFDEDRQRRLVERLVAILGFDRDHGRLDTSHHPFTGGVPDDVRITTRYSETDFTAAIMAAMHETGHALYERGLPPAWRHQPVGEARGMTLHESQSLLFEMHACRSPGFVAFLAPMAREALADERPAIAAENLQRLVLRVEPGLIRVDADEVTYPLHVIQRYRLERALLAGDLAVRDLPAAWNDALQRLLAVRAQDDRDGCMQDIHWYGGDFGYFPTYTLGALAAAQLFAAAREQDAAIPAAIARGDFAPLRRWLAENVHAKGSLLDTQALLREATGAPLGTEAFKRHLEARYLDGAG